MLALWYARKVYSDRRNLQLELDKPELLEVAESEEERDQRQRLAELPRIPRNELPLNLKPSSDHVVGSLERRTLARDCGGRTAGVPSSKIGS